MANGEYYKARFAGSLYAFIVLCTHFIYVHGRGHAIQKTKEIGILEGAVKTIESEDGDVIYCVDINKQPAFNHPLLKNHTIQMKPPNFLASGLSVDTKNPMLFQSWHKNGECPEGTIPIIRTQKLNYPPRGYPPIPKSNRLLQGLRHEYAQITITNNFFDGAHAFIGIWKPQVVNKDEYSSAQIWVLGSSDLDLNAVEAGWMVKGGDDKSRLFIYWTTDGYQITGCYNLECPGFVQINKNIALGGSLEPVSVYNDSKQMEIQIDMRWDGSSSNWWLLVQNQIIGYWPGSLFTEFRYKSSTTIIWGGEVINENADHHTATQMGSGHFPNEGFGKASLFRNVQFYRGSNLVDAQEAKPYAYATYPNCYDVNMEHNDADGTRFYFGGPGFSQNCLF